MARSLDVRTNLADFIAQAERIKADQIPQALAWTINASVDAAKPAMRAEMERVFDRPTPFTLNAVYGSYASKRRLEGHLLLKDSGGGADALPGAVNKGTAARAYLAPEIEGGVRPLKRAESALRAAGLLPPGLFLVPGRAAPLDAYGNVPKGFMVRMLSDLRALRETGSRANRKAGPRTGNRASNYFFAVPDPRSKVRNPHLKPGIYWHMPGGLVVALFHFTRQPGYTARFDFYGTAQRLIAAELPRQFPVQWRRALATDRGVRAA